MMTPQPTWPAMKIDLLMISPLLVLATTILFLIAVVPFVRRPAFSVTFSILGLVGAIATLSGFPSLQYVQQSGLFIMDSYGAFFVGLILLCSLCVTLFAGEQRPEFHPELYILLLLSTLGACAIVYSHHLIFFILGLEILSASAFVLIAYPRTQKSLEAGIKYLVLASIASSFLLLGSALIYLAFGTLELNWLIQAQLFTKHGIYFNIGFSLFIVGIGFKLALFPFHMWVADIYEGASPIVASFIATVSKGAVFAFAFRYLASASQNPLGFFAYALMAISIASILIGNWLALRQRSLKRIIAYSSIAHGGYVLTVFTASGSIAQEAVAYYLTVYFISILGAFGVITTLSGKCTPFDDIDEYRGLAWSKPFAAAVLAIMLFSLAGIPLTAGFIGKFYLLGAGVQSAQWLAVYALILGSAIGLYYYLRVISLLFWRAPCTCKSQNETLLNYTLLGGLALLTILLGVYPGILIQM